MFILRAAHLVRRWLGMSLPSSCWILISIRHSGYSLIHIITTINVITIRSCLGFDEESATPYQHQAIIFTATNHDHSGPAHLLNPNSEPHPVLKEKLKSLFTSPVYTKPTINFFCNVIILPMNPTHHGKLSHQNQSPSYSTKKLKLGQYY